MSEILVDKLIVTQCVTFAILTSIIISNKFHDAKSFFERIIGVVFASIGFFWTYLFSIYLIFYMFGY